MHYNIAQSQVSHEAPEKLRPNQIISELLRLLALCTQSISPQSLSSGRVVADGLGTLMAYVRFSKSQRERGVGKVEESKWGINDGRRFDLGW